jgi:hypothetical protein
MARAGRLREWRTRRVRHLLAMCVVTHRLMFCDFEAFVASAMPIVESVEFDLVP